MDTWTHGHMDTWTHGHMDMFSPFQSYSWPSPAVPSRRRPISLPAARGECVCPGRWLMLEKAVPQVFLTHHLAPTRSFSKNITKWCLFQFHSIRRINSVLQTRLFAPLHSVFVSTHKFQPPGHGYVVNGFLHRVFHNIHPHCGW